MTVAIYLVLLGVGGLAVFLVLRHLKDAGRYQERSEASADAVRNAIKATKARNEVNKDDLHEDDGFRRD